MPKPHPNLRILYSNPQYGWGLACLWRPEPTQTLGTCTEFPCVGGVWALAIAGESEVSTALGPRLSGSFTLELFTLERSPY